jgi:hypothetical protein
MRVHHIGARGAGLVPFGGIVRKYLQDAWQRDVPVEL